MSQLIVQDDQTWQLSGELTFDTVGMLLAVLHNQLEKSCPQMIDLAQVTRTDSAGLALMIELCRITQPNALNFQNMPTQMQHLATLSGVNSLLEQESL